MPTAPAHETATRHITLPCSACGKWNRLDADRAAKGPKCGSCGTPLAVDRPVLLTDETFDRVIGGTAIPVLVDFYADWCGPCQMMAPAVDALAKSNVGRALVAKLDTDASPRVASRFQIRGIPTTVVFRGGKESKRQSGAVALGTLQSMLT